MYSWTCLTQRLKYNFVCFRLDVLRMGTRRNRKGGIFVVDEGTCTAGDCCGKGRGRSAKEGLMRAGITVKGITEICIGSAAVASLPTGSRYWALSYRRLRTVGTGVRGRQTKEVGLNTDGWKGFEWSGEHIRQTHRH